ncbi:lipopolysaccharide biosynthesis protein, partial [Cellulomonas endophytica]|uniref:lipopolysaccharide biosynthesis protein n=1 Tax=Cellulomonas endophytica TaxID=2494735 RepID=UPI001F0CB26E
GPGAPVPPPPGGAGGLGGRAARGAASTGAGLVAKIGLQLVGTVVLARLLLPEDYGLIAMVLAIIGVGETVRDFGLSSAAIQSPDLSRAQRSNLFWVNTGIGAVLGLVVLAGSGAIAGFYDEPALAAIAQALAVTFLLNGASTQYRADLVRGMRFGTVAKIDVLGPALALGTAVALAAAGAGYWALVVQQLVQAVVLLVGVVAAARWLPRRYDRTAPMRAFFRFGGNLLASQLLGYAANNVDTLVIGQRFGAGPLGVYNRGFQLLMSPLNQVRAPSTTVALPVLARAKPGPEFDGIVHAGQRVMGYPLAVGLALVAGCAVPLVELLLGPTWSQVPPILRLLAVAGLLQTLAHVGYWVYLSRGLTKDLLQYSVISAAIRIACVLGGSIWGIVGVAAGYALAPAIAWPLSLWWLHRAAGLPVGPLYAGASRILLVGTLTAVGSYGAVQLLAGTPVVVQVLLGAVAGVVAAALALLLPAVRSDLALLVRAGRAGLRRKG